MNLGMALPRRADALRMRERHAVIAATRLPFGDQIIFIVARRQRTLPPPAARATIAAHDRGASIGRGAKPKHSHNL